MFYEGNSMIFFCEIAEFVTKACGMVTRIETVAFEGVQASVVEVQVHIGAGLPAFTIVGLPDKSVAESRERVRAALQSMGISLPAKKILINLILHPNPIANGPQIVSKVKVSCRPNTR